MTIRKLLAKKPREEFVRILLFLAFLFAGPGALQSWAIGPVKASGQAKPAIAAKAVVSDKAVVSAKAMEAAPELYRYNPAQKPDPFRPFIETEIAKKKLEVKKKSSAISPLQSADIAEFKLVGIGGDENHRTAIVEQGKGKFYPLAVGSMIGQNNGRVAEILSDSVIVEEPLGTGLRKSKVKRLVIKLRENQGEEKP